jgi:hypothetical protein
MGTTERGSEQVPVDDRLAVFDDDGKGEVPLDRHRLPAPQPAPVR